MSKQELDLKKIAKHAVLTIVILWALSFLLFFFSSTDRGTFGDMFGAVNALFSGLAFGGIILTILLQRQELALQREELQHTREELKRSADSQEESQKALKRQAENLKISAKLTALNTLFTYYAEQEQHYSHGDHPNAQPMREKRMMYLRQIEEILDAKSDN